MRKNKLLLVSMTWAHAAVDMAKRFPGSEELVIQRLADSLHVRIKRGERAAQLKLRCLATAFGADL